MEHSPLGGLPAEVRNCIWEYSVANTYKTLIIGSNFAKQPALTRTCMQIRNEALNMFYANNDFKVRIRLGSSHLTRNDTSPGEHIRLGYAEASLGWTIGWLQKLDPVAHACVRSLTIHINCSNILSYYRCRLGEPDQWALFGSLLAECSYTKARLHVQLVPNAGAMLGDPGYGTEGSGVTGLKAELAGCGLDVELPEEQQ